MPVTRTMTYSTFDDTLDVLDQAISELKALNTMIMYLVRADGLHRDISDGLWCLFDQQCQDLEHLRKALADLHNEDMTGKLKLRGLDTVTQWYGVPPQTVSQVIRHMTGIRVDPSAFTSEKVPA